MYKYASVWLSICFFFHGIGGSSNIWCQIQCQVCLRYNNNNNNNNTNLHNYTFPLSLSLSLSLSIYLSIYISIYLSIYLSFIISLSLHSLSHLTLSLSLFSNLIHRKYYYWKCNFPMTRCVRWSDLTVWLVGKKGLKVTFPCSYPSTCSFSISIALRASFPVNLRAIIMGHPVIHLYHSS